MTPAQLEHLKLIDAHLANLLAIADKRTPGEWEKCGEGVAQKAGYLHVACDEHDSDFIASGAGNAEAGWRATRAAIAEILSAHSARYDSWCLVCQELNQDPGKLEDYPPPPWSESILAAFPLELIQKP